MAFLNRRSTVDGSLLKPGHARPNVQIGASSFPNNNSTRNGSRTSTGTDAGVSGRSRAQDQARLADLLALVQETGEIAVSNGPKGLARAIQGATAVASLAQSYLQTGTNPLDAPQVVLRKLFESLGATYIKVSPQLDTMMLRSNEVMRGWNRELKLTCLSISAWPCAPCMELPSARLSFHLCMCCSLASSLLRHPRCFRTPMS